MHTFARCISAHSFSKCDKDVMHILNQGRGSMEITGVDHVSAQKIDICTLHKGPLKLCLKAPQIRLFCNCHSAAGVIAPVGSTEVCWRRPVTLATSEACTVIHALATKKLVCQLAGE